MTVDRLPLKYTIKPIRDKSGFIKDLEFLSWNNPEFEIVKQLANLTPPVSYKSLENKYGFDKSFFQTFAMSIESSALGNFYYINKEFKDRIFKINFSYIGEILQVLMSVENEIHFEDFEEINDIRYFYENIFFSSSDAIFIIEYKDNEFRYLTTNKKHRDETGFSFNDVHNKTPRELVGEELGAQLESNYKKALASEDTIAYEEYLKLPGGAKYWLTQLKKIQIEKSNKTYIIGSSRDITDLKNKEIRNLKLLSDLEESNAIKNKFFTIIAHDLKNPIYNSLSISDLLYESLESLSEKELKDYLKLLKVSLKNSSDLLNNLLAWSSSQIKGIHVEPEPVHVKKLILQILEGFEVNITDKNLSIELDNLDNLIAYCDVNSLYFIFRNLMSNAIKFSKINGKILIYGKQVSDTEIQISFQDFGIGISDSEKEKLFTYQSTTKSGTVGEKGSGLGLALVKEFVVKNNGKLFYESELGKGSVFSVILPSTTLHSQI